MQKVYFRTILLQLEGRFSSVLSVICRKETIYIVERYCLRKYIRKREKDKERTRSRYRRKKIEWIQ